MDESKDSSKSVCKLGAANDARGRFLVVWEGMELVAEGGLVEGREVNTKVVEKLFKGEKALRGDGMMVPETRVAVIEDDIISGCGKNKDKRI